MHEDAGHESVEDDKQIDVSIVIPAYQEQEAIGGVIDSIRAAMTKSSYRYEIIVVDDNSRDRTGEIARSKGTRVCRHKENLGSGASRKTGIVHARGDFIVMIDADGSYPADKIPALLQYLPEYDQVIGSRQTEEGSHRWLRSLVKGGIKRIASQLVGKEIPDLNSGLRAFKRDCMLKYLYLIPDGFSCVSTMTLAFLSNRHPVKFVSVPYYKRLGHSKFHPIKDTYQYLLTVIRVATYFNPLGVFLPLSLFLIGIGVLKSILDLLLTSTIQESDIIAILSGLVVAAIGILADLIITQGKKEHGPS